MKFLIALLLAMLAALAAGAQTLPPQTTWYSNAGFTPNMRFTNAPGLPITAPSTGTNLYIECSGIKMSAGGAGLLLQLGQSSGTVTTNYQWWMSWSDLGAMAKSFASSDAVAGEDRFVRLSPKGDSPSNGSEGGLFSIALAGFGDQGIKYFHASGSYQNKSWTQGEVDVTFHNWANANPFTSVLIKPDTGTFSGVCNATSY